MTEWEYSEDELGPRLANNPKPVERCRHGIREPHRCRDCEHDVDRYVDKNGHLPPQNWDGVTGLDEQ